MNDVVLNHLFNLAQGENSNTLTKGLAGFKLAQLRSWLEARQKSGDGLWTAHYQDLANRIQQFQEKPEDFETPAAIDPPPGQPIGMSDLRYCSEDR